MYGNECINPKRMPKEPTQQYVLMLTRGTGCGTLGENPLSERADSQKEWAFLQDNQALLQTGTNSALNLPNFE